MSSCTCLQTDLECDNLSELNVEEPSVEVKYKNKVKHNLAKTHFFTKVFK